MLTRRGFLQFVVGGALGAVFSPLPWRIADELVLFSQRWTPQGAPGDESWCYSICQLCPGGCGLKVRKISERVVQVEANPLSPINRGVCPLGAASVQYLYGDKRRIKKPLKRTGKRGEGKWQEIEWAEALNLLTSKLNDLKGSGATEGLLCIDGSVSKVMSGLLKKFCYAYGTSNYFHVNADVGASIAIKEMQDFNGCVGFDLENADYVLSFGSQLLEGWGAPGNLQALYNYWFENPLKPKVKVVQIEPRMSDTAAKASEWLPNLPGTEALVALGLAWVILKEGKYNPRFTGDADFERFKRAVLEGFNPDKLEEKTGLCKDDFIRVAREFCNAKHPIAVWGRGKGFNSTGAFEVLAIHSLNALVGNINRKGGTAFFKDVVDEVWPEISTRQPRDLGKFIESVGAKKVYAEIALVCEANPAYKYPVSFGNALQNVPFVVTFTPFMNDTALVSDLVLPTPFYMEKWEAITTPRGFSYPVFGLSCPVCKSSYGVKHPGDVVLAVSKTLGLKGLPWDNYRNLLQYLVEKIWSKGKGCLLKGNKKVALPSSPRQMWSELTTCVWANPEAVSGGIKKFDFAPSVFAEGIKRPVWSVEGKSEDYPFTLIPCEYLILPQDLGAAPFLVKQLPDTVLKGSDLCVEVHPETASQCGVKNGELALLQTPLGQARVRVFCNECIRPGIIGIPVGLGHKGYDEYLAGKGINAYTILGYNEEATGVASYVMNKANLVKI